MLVILLAAALTAVSAVSTQLRCVDAAREGARAAARGERDPAAFARRVAPAGATVRLSSSGDLVRVEVTVRARSLGRLLPGPMVDGTAVAAREPGTGTP
ncbi:hypothetical protein GCM10009765_05000 [Fodinicola feengrottensis]|uniref:Pilus assembly protein TadE n=1 Tax=Fodinicola feengrottensis TaxID=435914 RepID=A0ABP4RNU3_9ACTN